MEFRTKYNNWMAMVNNALDKYIPVKDAPEKTIYEAMRYSLLGEGKRLRPILALAVCELLGGDPDDVMPFACAIEMIHTYSLIHDDLPVMDNDDYRRGRLTNHRVFGEAKAVLAGDSLLNLAFEIMLEDTLKAPEKMTAKVEAMAIIARAAGPSGMIGGQMIDLESENREISAELLEYMHRCKTGALIEAPVMAAAVLCGADPVKRELLGKYARSIGLAFQIKDDVLDVEGCSETMGKSKGSDAKKKKQTFAVLYGLDGAKEKLRQIIEQAVTDIAVFGEKGEFLKSLARFIAERTS